jgi:hypothetical protein
LCGLDDAIAAPNGDIKGNIMKVFATSVFRTP